MADGPNLAAKAGTASRFKVLKAGAVTNAEAAQYTVPGGRGADIRSAAVTNTTGGALTISVSVVPESGTASAANRIVSALSIAAGATTELTALKGVVLGGGDKLSAIGSAAGLSIVITGVEYTGAD